MYEIRPEAILRGRQRDVKSERIDIWVTLTGVGLKYSTVASDPLQVHFMQLTPTRDNKTWRLARNVMKSDTRVNK